MADPAEASRALSPRELEVATAYSEGLSYKEIARLLDISPATVRTHLGTIYEKLGVSSKIQLLNAVRQSSGGSTAYDASHAKEASPSEPEVLRHATIVSVLLKLSEVSVAAEQLEATAVGLSAARNEISRLINDYRGILLSDGGAEISAAFGAPAADETDAERAVRCGLEIGARIAEVADAHQLRMMAQVGIYTGPSIVRASPSGRVTVSGHAPLSAAGIARRLSQGGVAICPRTRAGLGGLFSYSALDASDGGSDESGGAARVGPVEGAPGFETRFEALHGARLSPFVGRTHELGMLADLLGLASEGTGQAVILIGEPGIGKSRLVHEVLGRAPRLAGGTISFQCSPEHTSSPLAAVAEGLLRHVGATRSESSLGAVVSLFAEAIEDPESAADLLGDLLARHERAPAHQPAMSPEKRMSRTLSLLDGLVSLRARRGTTAVVFEDMHWADPTTLQWFGGLAEVAPTLPVLVLATARPEFAVPSARPDAVRTLVLGRLSKADAARLAAAQGDSDRLASDAIERVARRSEGVPLYAEELVRGIVDLGEVEGAVPGTLRSLLMSRLDRLGAARDVAQAAAVIGRDFDLETLAAILPHGPRALRNSLQALVGANLIHRRGATGSAEYVFKHALIRDAAYESLVSSRRKELHLKLANHLVEGSRSAPEMVARHFGRGGERDRAASFWHSAARHALRKGALAEARRCIGEGLASAAAIEAADARDTVACDLLIARWLAEYPRGDVAHLLGVAQEAEASATRIADDARLSRVLDLKTYALASSGRIGEAIETGKRGVAICSKRPEDVEAFVGTNMMLGRAYYAAGRYAEAVAQGEIVRDYLGDDVEKGAVKEPLNQSVSVHVWLCLMRSELGDFQGAEFDAARAAELLLKVNGQDHARLWRGVSFARLRFLRQDHAAVVAELEPLLDYCRQEYPVYLPRVAMSYGASLAALGRIEMGLSVLDEATHSPSTRGFKFARSLLLSQHSYALLLAGETSRAMDVAERSLAVARDAGEVGNLGWGQLRAAEAARQLGRDPRAFDHAEKAAEIATASAMQPLLACLRALRMGQMQ